MYRIFAAVGWTDETKTIDVIDDILFRIGKRYDIPVVRCEDFGHGINNTILPIGIRTKLDTETNIFCFAESGVAT